jgi:hypothetical protein
MRGRPKRYGETSEEERQIIAEIIFARRPGQKRKKSFRAVADDLNASGRWPRRAEKWNSMLVFHVWKMANKPGREVSNG